MNNDPIFFLFTLPSAVAAAWLLWQGFKLARRFSHFVRLRRAGIADIDRMNGGEFEVYLEILFTRQGYRVEQLPLTGDYGADLIIEKGGVRTAVQAKRYQGSVGVDAVQQIFAANAFYDTDGAMVVTNSHFTRQANRLADKIGVELWGRDRLLAEILKGAKNGKK